MISTLEIPVAFFESFIVDEGLGFSKRKYIQDIIEHLIVHIININNTEGIINYLDLDEGGNTKECIYNYNREL